MVHLLVGPQFACSMGLCRRVAPQLWFLTDNCVRLMHRTLYPHERRMPGQGQQSSRVSGTGAANANDTMYVHHG